MTLAEVLHGLIDKVHGWGTQPEQHAAVREHFAEKAPANAEPKTSPATDAEAPFAPPPPPLTETVPGPS